METPAPAEQALQLLFKKLHPHLEDAAHALATQAGPRDLERLHQKLTLACHQASEVLDGLASRAEEPLAGILDTLSANLLPVGGSYQQLLILVQLCLEEAPADLLPFTPAGSAAASGWGKRMVAFLARLEDPAQQARARWAAVDPDLGDECLGDPLD
ncbi:hypothetical protein [Mesoterricola silvestris]|uniref:Uncharacterized protein n=1 Tax=Mesoterricola silvestris TaxID=2927979 RepID=A0AA48KBM1_9BACT|nr:hypothetical protein [Mesoterricola silvestris]BDU74467.1 hypothetical protein METEAL_36410 [Mesoterricola silvestris]